jgi:PncC family amidohydrolase
MFDDSLLLKAKNLIKILQATKTKLVSAESCSGGLVASLITEISGASQVFDRGFVTYCNESKVSDLGVEEKTLENFGAVSRQVAKEMALGAIKNSNAALSIATTGVAGPNGGSLIKPVGLVYIASYNKLNDNLAVKEFNFSGDRGEVRLQTVEAAINTLIQQTKILSK